MTQNKNLDKIIPFPEDWTMCDGHQLRHLLQAALAMLEKKYEHVNQLNVFPIPDGDTGTNMLLTVRKAYAAIHNGRLAHIGQVADQFAQGSFMKARGNSGVILSQIFRGLADGLVEKERASAQDFAAGFEVAAPKSVW